MLENSAHIGHWSAHRETDGAGGIAFSDLPLRASPVSSRRADYTDVNATIIPICTDFLARSA
jgi:hypothetical protein